MKLRFSIPIFIIAFLLQSTFLNAFAVLGVTPNLLVILLICYDFTNKDENGFALALLLSFALDISSGLLGGVSALAMFVVHFFIAILKENFNVENLVVAVPIGVLATIIFDSVYFFTYKLFDSNYNILYWMKMELVEIAYNFIVFTLIYMAFLNVNKGKKDRYKKWGKY